jgi:hypothetical protein
VCEARIENATTPDERAKAANLVVVGTGGSNQVRVCNLKCLILAFNPKSKSQQSQRNRTKSKRNRMKSQQSQQSQQSQAFRLKVLNINTCGRTEDIFVLVFSPYART